MREHHAPHHEFQYASAAHQASTERAGMWLFLASEMLFFGGLFLVFVFCRHQNPAGFDVAARHTTLWIGAVNTVLLLTSSAVFSLAPALAAQDRAARIPLVCGVTAALGVSFLVLKGLEWNSDFTDHLWPGAGFALAAQTGAALFFAFYFVATFLHGAHMLIGLGLLAWLARKARTGGLADGWSVPADLVGLYWSFVDMVWLVLFPLLYLLGRTSA